MESNHHVPIDANRLRGNNASKKAISAQITEILRFIKEEIVDAYKGGLHEICVNLPITFAVPNISNADAQRMVWGQIIDVLTKKNYRVKLHTANDRCMLHITWLSQEDEAEIEYQNKIIARAMNK